MATLAATISTTGIVAPDYSDILQQVKIIYWSIYGSDALLDADTQDGQFLAALAQAIFDNNQTQIDLYNSFSPATARDVGLSSLVKINGLRRQVASNSTAVVTIVGVVGTQINGGIISSNLTQSSAEQWFLPDVVNIPDAGTIDVTATAADAGAIAATPGSLTVIITPTRGWQSVTNAQAAVVGQPVETDAQLRVRQAKSTALPAQTVLEGIYAAVNSVTGVDALKIYENNSDTADGNGIPSHSIAVVVSGGTVDSIVSAIALKKSPGVGTAGSTTRTVFDKNGVPNTIKYYPLTVVPMRVQVTIHPLVGYVSTTGDALCQAIADFINNVLEIGENSYLARLYTPANLTGDGIGSTYVVLGIQQARDMNALAPADVAITFREGATIDVSNITLVLA